MGPPFLCLHEGLPHSVWNNVTGGNNPVAGKSRTIQLLNDVSRIIAVGYLGLVMIELTSMTPDWAVSHLPARYALFAFFAIIILIWPAMAFLLGSRFWTWICVIASTLSIPMSYSHSQKPESTTQMLFPIVFFVTCFILWGIGLSGAWLARHLHMDQRLDRWKYWWIIALPCICLVVYTNTAGYNAALRTVRAQVRPQDSLSIYSTFPEFVIPAVVKYPKDKPPILYTLDPTGRIVIGTTRYAD
jgi:hypothetical protein